MLTTSLTRLGEPGGVEVVSVSLKKRLVTLGDDEESSACWRLILVGSTEGTVADSGTLVVTVGDGERDPLFVEESFRCNPLLRRRNKPLRPGLGESSVVEMIVGSVAMVRCLSATMFVPVITRYLDEIEKQ